MKNQLHPGAKWLFRVKAYLVMIILPLILGWIIIPALAIINPGINTGILLIAIIYIALIIAIGEVYSTMAYTRWFYEFAENELKLERGIIWKRYSNVPYARVQNVDVQRGVLARLFGFSTVMIQTAGYSGQKQNTEGYIPAVSENEAEKIRVWVMKKISDKNRISGL